MELVLNAVTKLPPLVQMLIAAVVSTATLLATQGLVDNRTEKLVTGLAAVWIPLGYLLLVAALHLGEARVTAARIQAGLPTSPQDTP